MKKHIITEAEYEAVKAAAKRNKDKKIDKKLQVIILRYEGLKDREIGMKLGYNRQVVSRLCAEFKRDGLKKYSKNKYGGNHRNLSYEEEEEILKGFRETAKEGHIVSAWEIKQAFDRKLGRDTGRGYIYMLLKRHKWRKVMPRAKHPKKAGEEEIAASKKLTIR